jgi:hypothetical protein
MMTLNSEGTEFWRNIVRGEDGAESQTMGDFGIDRNQELRLALKDSNHVRDISTNIEWFREWLDDSALDSGRELVVVTIGETDAENALRDALIQNESAMRDARAAIDHPSSPIWNAVQVSKYLFSAARDEMIFTGLEEEVIGIDGEPVASEVFTTVRSNPGLHVTGDMVRMLRVAECKLELNVVGDERTRVFILGEEEGAGRNQHLISETIGPLSDELFRHYDGCIEEDSPYRAPDQGDYPCDWQGIENLARSFHAMARGLHEEIIRPLAIHGGFVDPENDGELPTQVEFELLRRLLIKATPVGVRAQWPTNGTLISGSLEGMISCYCISTWKISINMIEFHEGLDDDVRRLGRALCNQHVRIENQWSTERSSTYFVWKGKDEENGGGKLALSAHPDDFNDIVTAWSVSMTVDNSASGDAARRMQQDVWNDRQNTLRESDCDSLKEELEVLRPGISIPFPSWIDTVDNNEGELEVEGGNPERIRHMHVLIVDGYACSLCDVEAGVDCLIEHRRRMPTGCYTGDPPPEEERIVPACKVRFNHAFPLDSNLRNGFLNDKEKVWWQVAKNACKAGYIPNSTDWLSRRWESIRGAINVIMEGVDIICVESEATLPILTPTIEITTTNEGETSSVSFEPNDEGIRVWNPRVNHTFEDGWWPGIDIQTNRDIAITTLESLSGDIEFVVLRIDSDDPEVITNLQMSLSSQRRALGVVRVREWLGALKNPQRQDGQA